MKQQGSKIGLQIRHPSRDLSNLSIALGLQPEIIWKKGDERRTPKGKKIGGVRDYSRWSTEFKFRHRQALPDKIAAILALLTPHRAMLRKISSTGGTISLYIGWFCDDHTGMTLNTQILSAIADLRISIELFIYVPDEPK
jgi:hypothetical protein